MGQKTLINGTAYDTKSGKCLVDGTGYAIQKGRTCKDGTGYDIKLKTGETWLLNETLSFPYVQSIQDLSYYGFDHFESNGMSFVPPGLVWDNYTGNLRVLYGTTDRNGASGTPVYENGAWLDPGYRTIILPGETGSTDLFFGNGHII